MVSAYLSPWLFLLVATATCFVIAYPIYYRDAECRTPLGCGGFTFVSFQEGGAQGASHHGQRRLSVGLGNREQSPMTWGISVCPRVQEVAG